MAIVRQSDDVPSWEKGAFYNFRATVTFHIGGEGEVVVSQGDELEYDGFTVKYGPDEFSNNRLRGAVRKKWLVPVEDTTTQYKPESVIVDVPPAVEDVARSSREKNANQVVRMETTFVEDETIQFNRSVPSAQPSNAVGTVSEGGVPVGGRILTPANAGRVDVSDPSAAQRAIKAVEKAVAANPNPTPASQPNPTPTPSPTAPSDAEARRQERLSQLASVGAIEVNGDEDLNAYFETETGGGIKFADPNGTQKGVVRTDVGVDWDLSPHWKTRVKIAQERFGKSQEILRAICDVETEGVVNALQTFISDNF